VQLKASAGFWFNGKIAALLWYFYNIILTSFKYYNIIILHLLVKKIFLY